MTSDRGVVFLSSQSPRAGLAVPSAHWRPPWLSSSSNPDSHTQQPARRTGPWLTPQGGKERVPGGCCLIKARQRHWDRPSGPWGRQQWPPQPVSQMGLGCGSSFFPTTSSEPSQDCWCLRSPGNIFPTGGLLWSVIYGTLCLCQGNVWLISPAPGPNARSLRHWERKWGMIGTLTFVYNRVGRKAEEKLGVGRKLWGLVRIKKNCHSHKLAPGSCKKSERGESGGSCTQSSQQ